MKDKQLNKNNFRKFTDEEKAALRETLADSEGENAVMAKINAMQEPDRTMAKKIHQIVRKTAPELMPKTWYGMPAYADKDGKVVCFFQDAKKFKTRYATLGFSDKAKLDEGNIWPNAYALAKLTAAEEKRIAGLVKKRWVSNLHLWSV